MPFFVPELAQLADRFAYHPPPNEDTAGRHQEVRNLCAGLAQQLLVLVPNGREQSLAITNLEQVMMWANAGIARHPVLLPAD